MKQFKKILYLLIFLLFFSFVGCSEEEPEYGEIGEYSNSLKLTTSYEGMSFLKDGIGKVTLYQTVDGDTAHFRDNVSNENFTARFLCIDTPESTGRIDAWGKAASKFVGEILKSATEIVCESEVVGEPAKLDSTYKRYLSFIWYKTEGMTDFKFLNLELIENGYSKFTTESDKYGEIFQKAHLKSYDLKIKVYGEKDPDYDYSGSVHEVTIAEIRKNIDSYTDGSTLKLTARVMRIVGDNLYIQDLDQTYNEEKGVYEYGSIYVFSGYGSSLSKIELGKVISFEAQCVINETYGSQLTNPKRVKIVENTDEYTITELDGSKQIDLASYEGFVVLIKNLRVKSVGSLNDGAYTIYCVTESGQEINVRVDDGTFPKLEHSSIQKDKVYNVIGGISKFNDTFQIMIANQKGEAVNDFVLSE